MIIEAVKKEILVQLNQKKLSKNNLMKILGIKGEASQKIFKQAIDELILEEKIILNEKGFYNISTGNSDIVKGKIYIDKGGKGHFIGKQGDKEKKYLINNKYLNGALDGDFVLVKNRGLKRTYDLKLGEVEKIIKRSREPQIFIYEGGGIFTLYSGCVDVYLKVSIEECKNLVKGTLILATLDETPLEKNIYNGKIVKILGHVDDPKSIILAIASKQGFNNEFCKAALKEAQKMPFTTLNEDITNRVDLRDEKIFTIDGEDTKDIDDSIGIKKDGNNYILKINIADVSHYVKKESALDKEAYQRGNSVYPADMVIPMFPHIISNGICSLNQNCDRLTITGEITLNQEFEIIDFKLYESIINSKKQMTYENVNKVLKGEEVEGYENYKEDLKLLNKISQKLEQKRKENGALEFYGSEIKIITDNCGNSIDIKNIQRGQAEKIIENLMILMNSETAKLLDSWGYEIVYRVHNQPQAERLSAVLQTLKEQGIENNNMDRLLKELNQSLKGKTIKSKNIQEFLNSIKDEEYYETISKIILRSMKRATYQSENEGHFGLALDNYIHFTSPIRRYADLINHRIAKQIISYDYNPTIENYNKILEELEKIEKTLPNICKHVTETEYRADKVEEEADKIKKIEYFESHLEDFEGPIKAKILNITKSGIIAKIEDTFEIIIPIENLTLSKFKYKKASRNFQNQNETISLGDEIYVFDPEVFKEKSSITYTNVSKEQANLIEEHDTRKFIKTKKIRWN